MLVLVAQSLLCLFKLGRCSWFARYWGRFVLHWRVSRFWPRCASNVDGDVGPIGIQMGHCFWSDEKQGGVLELWKRVHEGRMGFRAWRMDSPRSRNFKHRGLSITQLMHPDITDEDIDESESHTHHDDSPMKSFGEFFSSSASIWL